MLAVYLEDNASPVDCREWDCLNAAYGGVVTTSSQFVTIAFRRVVDVSRLVSDYEALPHVKYVSTSSSGVTYGCGSGSNGCMRRSSDGTWKWLWWHEDRQCHEDYFRAETQADGGITFEVRHSDAGVPHEWFDDVSCY